MSPASTSWQTLAVAGSPMRAFLAEPDQGDAQGQRLLAIVVIQHAGGVDDFVQDISTRVAEAGLVAVAPDLYHRQDVGSGETGMQRMARLRDDEVMADVDAAVGFLREYPNVDSDRIGINGYCMGGRVAYMMAGARPDVFRACIAFYGGNTHNRWGRDEGATPFDLLSHIRCPVLSFFGGRDANPSPEDAFQIDAALKAVGVPHEFHSYPDAGHAYMNFLSANAFNQQAAESSWPLVVSFLQRRLGPAPVAVS